MLRHLTSAAVLTGASEAYFQGKRELFQGLAMEELEKEWVQHPIFHLDLNIEKYDSMESIVPVGLIRHAPRHSNIVYHLW